MWKFFLVLALMVVPACAQAPSTLPAEGGLGAVFESRVAGIALQPPEGGTLVRQVESGEVVRFVYPDRNWQLDVRTIHLAKPLPLSVAPIGNLSGGLLEITVSDMKARDPSVDVLLQEVKTFSIYRVGMIAARCDVAGTRELVQQAIFRSDDVNFYTVQMISPGRAKDDKRDGDDPAEVLAADTFEKVLDTVKLVDRSELKREQDERLLHTRGLFALWDEKKIRSVLVPERYLRLIREGKDVGYVQVKEIVATHAGQDGVEIDVKSHSVTTPDASVAAAAPVTGNVVMPAAGAAGVVKPTGPIQSDNVSKLFSTFDRRHEDWSVQTTENNGLDAPMMTSELGNSDMQIRHMFDQEKAAQLWKDPTQQKNSNPPVIEREKYTLSVSTYTKTKAGLPVERELPVFYLPQAFGQLLPRLLPLEEPQGYMFATYVSDHREVMARYVDVLPVEEVDLDGQKVEAVPVKDRIGADGAAITHYLSRQGQWLGSVSDDQKLMVLPSDEASLEKIWKQGKG